MHILMTKSAKQIKFWDSSKEPFLDEVTLVQVYRAFV